MPVTLYLKTTKSICLTHVGLWEEVAYAVLLNDFLVMTFTTRYHGRNARNQAESYAEGLSGTLNLQIVRIRSK